MSNAIARPSVASVELRPVAYLWDMQQTTRFLWACAALLCATTAIQAQVAPPTLVNAPDTVYVSLDTLSGVGVIDVHWDVVNDTEDTLELMVTRTFVDTVSPFNYPYVSDGIGSYERFCWGASCFNFGTDASPANPAFLVTLLPGDTTNTFISDFYPNGVTGTTTLRYCFHEEGPASLGACHDITFVVDGTVGVSAPEVSPSALTSMAPNPATDEVVLRFNEPRQGAVEFRNLVGQVIRTDPVLAGAQTLRVSLNDLASGIWLVSYTVDGVTVSTKRLVVR